MQSRKSRKVEKRSNVLPSPERVSSADGINHRWITIRESLAQSLWLPGSSKGHGLHPPPPSRLSHNSILTAEVIIARGPGLGRVKVSVATDVGPREVGVGQEAAFAIERGAIPMEAVGEEDHDVRL